MYLELQTDPMTTIYSASRKAVSVADLLGIMVVFTLGGIRNSVPPGMDPQAIENSFWVLVSRTESDIKAWHADLNAIRGIQPEGAEA
jgi:hypothetical protein